MKIGAVISAAGHKSQTTVFQPLLPVGNTTVIKRVIMALRRSGADPIVVVTGKDAKELEKHIARQKVICLRNENYETTQMLESICMGLNYVEDLCDRVLILPAKFPLLLPETIQRIIKSQEKIACPIYNGKRGHPVLISKELIPSIMAYTGKGGLGGFLRQPQIEGCLEEIQVEDRGIIETAEGGGAADLCQAFGQVSMHPVSRVYLECDEIFFGPGIAQFLTLVDHTNSMQAACRQMNMSYSKGWKIVKTAEKQLGYPLLSTRAGGAAGGCSELTPKGRDFLERFSQMEEALGKKAEELFWQYFGALQNSETQQNRY